MLISLLEQHGRLLYGFVPETRVDQVVLSHSIVIHNSLCSANTIRAYNLKERVMETPGRELPITWSEYAVFVGCSAPNIRAILREETANGRGFSYDTFDPLHMDNGGYYRHYTCTDTKDEAGASVHRLCTEEEVMVYVLYHELDLHSQPSVAKFAADYADANRLDKIDMIMESHIQA
jgi:hypothetical protein